MTSLGLVLSFVMSLGLASPADGQWVALDGGGDPGPAAVSLDAADLEYATVTVTLPGFVRETQVHDGTTYDLVHVLGGGPSATVGAPATPTVSTLLVVPPGAMLSVETVATDEVVLDGYTLLPLQPSWHRCDASPPPFTLDEAAYAVDAFGPTSTARVSGIEDMHGITFVRLTVNPIRYNPVTSQLAVATSVTVKLSFQGGEALPQVPFESTFADVLSPLAPNFDVMVKRGAINPETMLVIADPGFMSELTAYEAWKDQSGIPTTVVSTSTTGTDANSVKSYIQTKYASENLGYVLLVGDINQIGTFSGTGSCASDFFYSLQSGNDYTSDVLVGRLSANYSSEVATQVAKVINYESSPPSGSSGALFHKSMCISSSEGSGTSNDDYRSDIICNMQSSNGYTETTKLYASAGSNTVSNISTALNSGRGWVNYLGHGVATAWASTYPEYDVYDVQALTNTNKLPVIMDIACENGAFTDYETCFAEAWLKAGSASSPRGAVAIYAASTPSAWDEPAELAIGATEAYLDGDALTWGALLLAGRTYAYNQYGNSYTIQEMFEQFNIFGDPSLLVRSDEPTSLAVTHPSSVATGTSTVTVTVASGSSPIPNAVVTLIKTGQVYVVGTTDYNGSVSLSVSPSSSGSMGVYVTAHDYLPYNGSMSVGGTCTPSCSGKECGDDGCGGTCGTCASGYTCVANTCQEQSTDPCGGVTFEGCCEGTTLKYCQDGTVYSDDCTNQDASYVCGWYAGSTDYPEGYYCGPTDLVSTAGDPSGTFPMDCGGGTCTPSCSGKECGSDGCGGSCGTCASGETCQGYTCVTGGDSCGGLTFEGCCDGTVAKWCQDDAPQQVDCVTEYGAGTMCGWNSSEGYYYCGSEGSDPSGTYPLDCPTTCTPSCSNVECGGDGCGGSCGTCATNETCIDGHCYDQTTDPCQGVPYEGCCDGTTLMWCDSDTLQQVDCASADDGGTTCGWNTNNAYYDCGYTGGDPSGTYPYDCGGSCTPSCAGLTCGSDGCGGSCGTCPSGSDCVSGTCVTTCTPDCAGKVCGTDGCGGLCGSCTDGYSCTDGQCILGACSNECGIQDKTCTADGKLQLCGEAGDGDSCLDLIVTSCASGTTCQSGLCVSTSTPGTDTVQPSGGDTSDPGATVEDDWLFGSGGDVGDCSAGGSGAPQGALVVLLALLGLLVVRRRTSV